MIKKNPTITVYPVSWNGAGEQLKCQAVAELNGVRIFSDPKSDMDEAVTSLYAKCVDYCKLVTALSEYGSAPLGFDKLMSESKAAMKLQQKLSSNIFLKLDFNRKTKKSDKRNDTYNG